MTRLRWKRRLVFPLLVLAFLLLGCSISGYRYLDSIDWFVPRVHARDLQARAQREQPVGGGEVETVAFLRRLGFEDRYIFIEHGRPGGAFGGRLVAIEGWIPQPRCCLQPRQILVYCKFDDHEQLDTCTITGRGSPLDPSSGGWVVRTPVPAP